MATDYLSQALGEGYYPAATDATSIFEWDQINQWLGQMSETQRTLVLPQIVSQYQNASGVQADVLRTVATALQKELGGHTLLTDPTSVAPKSTPTPNAPTNTPQTLAGSSPIPATALTGGSLSETTPVGSVPVPSGAGGGQGFNEQLQSYYDAQFQQARTDPNRLAEMAGMDPAMLQQQYASYTNGFALAQQNLKPGFLNYEGAQATQPMTLPQFAQAKAQTMIGPWAVVLEAINTVWQSQMNEPLPPDLIQQTITQLNGMPQAQQSNVLYQAMQYMTAKASAIKNKGLFDQAGNYTQGILSVLPSSIMTVGGTGAQGIGTGSVGTSGIVGEYAQLHPSPFIQGQTIALGIAQAFQAAFNRAPTAADLAALGPDPTPAAIQNYINTQPMPGMNMTFGQYQAVQTNMKSLWTQEFGRAPTNAELQWGVGKSVEQLQAFVDNSPSSIPGATIGRVNDYTTFLNGLHATVGSFSVPLSTLDPSLISELHQHLTSAETGKAQPGPLQ